MSLSDDRRSLLELALSRTESYIGSADAKAGACAALVTGFTAVLVTSDRFLGAVSDVVVNPSANTAAIIVLVVSAAATLAAVLSVFAVLFPRTRAIGTSCLYFGGIARHKDAASLTREITDDGFDPDDDLANQVLACSRICAEKMRWARVASALTAVSVASCGAFMVLETIG